MEKAVKKINRERKNVKDKYSQLTVKDLKEHIKKLTESQRKVIYKYDGEDLDKRLPIDEEDRDAYYNALKRLDRVIKGTNKSRKNVRDLFLGYHVNDLKKYISMLPSLYQEIIYKYDGENLDLHEPIDRSNQNLYRKAVRNLKFLLNGNTPRVTMRQETRKNARDYNPGLSIEILKIFIDELPSKHKDIIYKYDGRNLDLRRPLTKKDNDAYYTAIDVLQNAIKGKRKIRSNVQDKYPFLSLEELKEYIDTLGKKYSEAIYKYDGESLDKRIPLDPGDHTYYNAVNKLAKVINGKAKLRKNVRDLYPELTIQKLKLYISVLDFAYEEIIMECDGENLTSRGFMSKEESKLYKEALEALNEIIKGNVLIRKNIRDYFSNLSFLELQNYINKLELKYQNIIYKYDGEFLDKRIPIKDEDKVLYKEAINRINALLNDNFSERQNVCDLHPLLSVYALQAFISDLKIDYQRVIYKYDGKSLDKRLIIDVKDKDLYKNAIKRLSTLTKEREEAILEEIYSKPNRLVYENLKNLSPKHYIIYILISGLYNGKNISPEKIAIVLNITLEEVLSIYNEAHDCLEIQNSLNGKLKEN